MSTCTDCEGMLDCQGCVNRVLWQLRDLPELYAQLELEAVDGTPTRSVGTGGKPASRPPLSVQLLDGMLLRIGDLDGLRMLEAYAGLLALELELTEPKLADTYAGRIERSCAFLRLHLEHAAQLPDWWPTFAGYVGQLVSGLRRILEPRRRWEGTQLPCQEADCDGVLARDLDGDPDELLCRSCDATWHRDSWAELGATVHAAGSVADVADELGLSHWTVRKWVQRGQVENVGTVGRPLVRYADVRARAVS